MQCWFSPGPGLELFGCRWLFLFRWLNLLACQITCAPHICSHFVTHNSLVKQLRATNINLVRKSSQSLVSAGSLNQSDHYCSINIPHWLLTKPQIQVIWTYDQARDTATSLEFVPLCHLCPQLNKHSSIAECCKRIQLKLHFTVRIS